GPSSHRDRAPPARKRVGAAGERPRTMLHWKTTGEAARRRPPEPVCRPARRRRRATRRADRRDTVRALTWPGRQHVSVEDVADPHVQEPTDAVIRVTSTAVCGSDLHLYGVLGMFLDAGDVLGHEAMGVVEEVGSEAGDLAVGDRVVVPFTISC